MFFSYCLPLLRCIIFKAALLEYVRTDKRNRLCGAIVYAAVAYCAVSGMKYGFVVFNAAEKAAEGCILVVRQIEEEHRAVMEKAGAVLVESGALLAEGNSLALDYNLPCVIGVAD